MKTKLIYLLTFITSSLLANQVDTVTIKVGEGSKVIFAIKDKKDLETMKKYNFQKLMDDMIYKLEMRDSTQLKKLSSDFLKKDTTKEEVITRREEPEPQNERYNSITVTKRYYGRRTRNTFNIDIGTNNYLNNGNFPSQDNSQYAVRPWGSWYVGLNSIYRTRMANHFFLEWGYGVSWYNFKFQDPLTQMVKDNTGVSFAQDTRGYSYTKSKLTAAFLNISVVPVFDFGGNKWKPSFFDGHRSSGFRLGAGPYVGYLIDSYTKQVYSVNNETKKERHHDNYYLNNLRYGVRVQVGFNDVDFFFNYDLNPLFATNKASNPNLNAFTFGVTF
ncbi:hypothetical protein WSM22_02540 [Cytophagales bacterium WSM2-2]|nr:hypothetical protein WSM22_02540 [Cytophagales bacterium WSM2-2]